VAGNDLYPVISACLMRLMPGMTLGPSESGEGAEVRISFGFRQVAPTRRR
jgi:hypothetical protein